MPKQPDLYDRLKTFIESTGLSNNKFGEKTRLSGAQISYMVSSKKKFGIDKLLNILNEFPTLNSEWLLKGDGEMMLDPNKQPQLAAGNMLSVRVPQVVTVDQAGRNNIIEIDAQAAAGFPANINNPEYFKERPSFRLPSPQFRNGTFICIQASGDSMHPTIYHHDWLIAQFVENPAETIKEGYVHVVVTQEGVVVKRVLNRIVERGKLVMQSDNPQYPTYEEDVANVLQVYKVTAKLTYILRNEQADLRADVNVLRGDLVQLQARVDNM
jgi:phage repressor protein C with HTH and peptisase S24 domain